MGLQQNAYVGDIIGPAGSRWGDSFDVPFGFSGLIAKGAKREVGKWTSEAARPQKKS